MRESAPRRDLYCIVDTVVVGLLAGALIFNASDPATSGLDTLAGLAILALLAFTVLPAALLLWRRKSEKLAFAFSLGLFVLIVALVIAAASLIATCRWMLSPCVAQTEKVEALRGDAALVAGRNLH